MLPLIESTEKELLFAFFLNLMLTLAKETSYSSISPLIWVMSATLEIALICSIGTNLRTSSLRCAYTMSFRVYPFAKRTSLLK